MTKQFFLRTATFLTALLGAVGSQANMLESLSPSTHILIFTTQQYPVNGIQQYPQASVYQIDAVNRLENMPEFTFQGSPQQAEQQARAFIQAPEFKEYEIHLKRGYDGLARAFYLGVKKVPAIVFQDLSDLSKNRVVYGITDIEQAVSLFLREQGR